MRAVLAQLVFEVELRRSSLVLAQGLYPGKNVNLRRLNSEGVGELLQVKQ